MYDSDPEHETIEKVIPYKLHKPKIKVTIKKKPTITLKNITPTTMPTPTPTPTPTTTQSSLVPKFDHWDPTMKVQRVLSFDVGIKNLAYAMVSYNPKNSPGTQFLIYHWGIIDLVTNEDILRCGSLIKSGKKKGEPCGNTASFFEKGNKDVAYCRVHYPKTELNQLVRIKHELLCEHIMQSGVRSGDPCNRKSSYYYDKDDLERMGYCTIHSKKQNVKLERYYTVDNISDLELKTKLFRELDKRPHFLHVDTVLIEYQPPHAREKMKSMMSSIYDYFVIRGIIDKPIINTVKTIDAKNKLTIYDGPALSCPKKEQYDRNKWYGREYCRWAIRGRAEFLAFFDSFKKQDDLADSFLQGAWYLAYGQHGKKGNISSSHQKLVYLEQNTTKYKKVRTVRPNARQIKKGRFTLSNIKYYVIKKSFISVAQWKKVKGLEESICFYFGSLDSFQKTLS